MKDFKRVIYSKVGKIGYNWSADSSEIIELIEKESRLRVLELLEEANGTEINKFRISIPIYFFNSLKKDRIEPQE